MGSPPIIIGNGDDSIYEPNAPGNEDSEELYYPKGTDSSKCMYYDWMGCKRYNLTFSIATSCFSFVIYSYTWWKLFWEKAILSYY